MDYKMKGYQSMPKESQKEILLVSSFLILFVKFFKKNLALLSFL